MEEVLIAETEKVVVKRMVLGPEEATAWHTDSCHRFTVVLAGSELMIEFKNGDKSEKVSVNPGMTGWDEPEERVHRAINIGTGDYEEIVTFLRDGEMIDPQPRYTL